MFSKAFRLFLTAWIFTTPLRAAEWAPFVIPDQLAADSPLVFPARPPIVPAQARLKAENGYFVEEQTPTRPVRIWGVNLCFGASLPDAAGAERLAARLAGAGINSVRIHHLDTASFPRGIWNPDQEGKTIDPRALERLDTLFDQLARRGIRINLNLHVGRTHSRALGLPDSGTEFNKIVTLFTPALIEAQKDYARQLLDHVNPHRNVRWADDPAIAFVEISNENSFFMWDGREKIPTLPPYYAEILQKQYNAWLQTRYGSDEKLRAAWNQGIQPLGENFLKNAQFKEWKPGENTPTDWILEQHENARATLTKRPYQDTEALAVEIADAGKAAWHLALRQQSLTLKKGAYYTVTLRLAAPEARTVDVNVSQTDSPWANLGLYKPLSLKPEWQTFHLGFIAREDEKNARLHLSFGTQSLPFYLAEIQIQPNGQQGLLDTESLEKGTVAVSPDIVCEARTADRLRFLAETEKTYWDGMRTYLKDGLKCRALVTGTIVFGPLGLWCQSDMDFIDTHAYWRHPDFPGRPWDGNNWFIKQDAMTDFPESATLFELAASRLAGKPFTLSEYNHPAPNDYQAETVPLVAAFGAAHDWSGVWLFDYAASSEMDYSRFNGYFDIYNNPAKWGFVAAASQIFQGTITPLPPHKPSPLVASNDPVAELASLYERFDNKMLRIGREKADLSWQNLLDHPFSWTLPNPPSTTPLPSQLGTLTTLKWENGTVLMQGAGGWVWAGHTGKFEKATAPSVPLKLLSVAGPEFATLATTVWLKPGEKVTTSGAQRYLIVACGRCENANMGFSPDRQTVGTKWGQAPVSVELVEARLALPEGTFRCQALGPDGRPTRTWQATGEISLSPQDKTMWYFLEKVD
ncbi:MAG TPA: carbohydrate binding domain-containing protein [Candidatus Sumerlaeota bacterium]|nr:carbohydrate binding domain-containing protein [Candidatus Sumerlaeota bacterium]